jgi:hypothetical protein
MATVTIQVWDQAGAATGDPWTLMGEISIADDATVTADPPDLADLTILPLGLGATTQAELVKFLDSWSNGYVGTKVAP